MIVHDPRFAHIPPALALPLISGHVQGSLRCPDNLTIVLMHNYTDTPLMEQSLRYTGIDQYVLLKPEFEGEWRDSIKLTTILRYLLSGACRTEYMLYADSRDCVLRADPRDAVALLAAQACDCLFSVEADGYGYQCMPEVRAWARQNALAHRHQTGYINCGVFVGRVNFVTELLQEAQQYILPTELSWTAFRQHLSAGTLCEALPEYPLGVGSDQQILRWLHPRFYPRMQCDYAGRLAVPR